MLTKRTQLTTNLCWLVSGIVLGVLLTNYRLPRAVALTRQAPISPLATAVSFAPTATSAPTAERVAVVPPLAPGDEQSNGVPVGFTEDGLPYRGAPDAPITMYEYSDYQCPYCGRHFTQTEPALVEQYVRSGHLRVVFRDFPLTTLHPNAQAAHRAALCAAEQGAPIFWAMHDQLFQTQATWSQLTAAADYFAKLAVTVGVARPAFQECMAQGNKDALIEQSLQAGGLAGFGGTPSFQFVQTSTGATTSLVGAQPLTRFAGVIDALLAGQLPPAEPTPPPPPPVDPAFWNSATGLAADPARPGYTQAGDQRRGNPDAPVTVIEISDFQCPFCQRHVAETQPLIDQTFVEAGTVRWVFRHFPLNGHAQAEAAGVAAECAGEQGEFWAMHDLLFTQVERWSVADATPIFHGLAQQLQLDGAQFAACLNDETMLQRVQADRAESAAFVQGTPTFLILFGDEQRIIPGALPAQRFIQVLQQAVDAVAE